MKKILLLLLSAVLALGLLTGCGGKSAPEPVEDPAAGESPAGGEDSAALASFSAGTLDGGAFTQDDVKAKDVTVMNFWALSCGPCIVEMPDLAAFAKALPDTVQVVTVCLDGGGSEDAVREVLDGAGFEGVTLLSADGDLLALAQSLMYTPTTIFIDSEGNLVGDAVIGGQEDLSGTFLAAVNRVLEAGGKDAVSLEE